MSHPDKSIAICVPVYNGSAFVRETLDAILAQSHRKFRLLISVDRGADDSLEICRGYARDPRVEVHAQNERMGWVRNTNWLLERARGDYVCITPHDDLIDPRYIETLLDHAEGHPRCAVAYSDILAFGDLEMTIWEPPLIGPRFFRLHSVLLTEFAAVAFRGLIRLPALRLAGLLRPNEEEDFAADATWVAQLARAGELHRIERPLYRKRFHPNNDHRRGARWPRERRLRAWAIHCAEMLKVALEADLKPSERLLLVAAAVARIGGETLPWNPVGEVTDAERTAMCHAFMRYARAAMARYQTNWDRLERHGVQAAIEALAAPGGRRSRLRALVRRL